MAKPKPEDAAEDAKKIVDGAKNFIEKAVADIGKTSATKQLILGTASGWYVFKYINTVASFVSNIFSSGFAFILIYILSIYSHCI